MTNKKFFIISSDSNVLKEFCAGVSAFAEDITAITFADEAQAAALAGCGANKLLYCPTGEHAPEDYAKAIADNVKACGNGFVLVDNTVRGKCLAGIIATYLDAPVFSGINTIEEENGEIVCRRIVYGGAAQRKEFAKAEFGVATAAGGLFGEYTALDKTAELSMISGELSNGITVIRKDEKKEATVNLAAAKRIVDIGRGWAKEEDLDIPRKLAAALDAEVGCSRPVAENNKWMPKSSYLGITGTQVKPELILCCGLSGQIQHIGGINKSRIIVAVDKDKSAPVFKNCDFGLVGDMYKIIPALTEKLS